MTGSIVSAASSLAQILARFYHGNLPNPLTAQTGLLDDPYSWWENAAFFDTLSRFSSITGDPQYNYMPFGGLVSHLDLFTNYTGIFRFDYLSPTDDNYAQSQWALAALSTNELKFPSPPGALTWLELAEAAFDNQLTRWDPNTCGGGLNWTYRYIGDGNLKNTAATGYLF